jgi:excisionase family DNA binding protein
MSDHAAERPVFTVAEIAEDLNLCTKTVYEMIARGDLKTLPNIRKKLVPRASLDEFIATAMVG